MRAAAANGLVMAGGNASLPFGVMLGLALYLVASPPPRPVSIRAAATTAPARAGALVYASLALRSGPRRSRWRPRGQAVRGRGE